MNEMSEQTMQRLPLEPYVGTKIIEACAMTCTDYNRRYGKALEAYEPDGYVVFYPDGYISWSPKSVFEEAYRKLNKSEISKVSFYR